MTPPAKPRSSVGRWLRRIAIGLLGLIVVLLVLGTGYEQISRSRVAKAFRPHGRLVDIGGRRIHLDCRGTGSPTVVFESGLDIYGSLSWATIHDSIAAGTRACAYDRAGIMWSDPSPGPRHSAAVAEDLHLALTNGNEKGPYVMVGHSLGGPYIMTFTKRYGSQVAGLVFVDASHPEQVERFKAVVGEQPQPPMALYQVVAKLAWTGIPRLAIPKGGNEKAPAAANAAMAAYAPLSLGPMLAESQAIDETMREAGTFRQLGDRPVVVLSAMKPLDDATLKTLKITAEKGQAFQAVWKALHDEEASWSSRSRHELVPDATHYIHVDRPDVVIRAIREVVDSVRVRPGQNPAATP
jgi:pimeloyl-ACP methyl ester carboxylesterase